MITEVIGTLKIKGKELLLYFLDTPILIYEISAIFTR